MEFLIRERSGQDSAKTMSQLERGWQSHQTRCWRPSRGLSGTRDVDRLEGVWGIRAVGNAMYFELSTVLLSGLVWIGIVAFLRLKKKAGFEYLIFFTIFYAYLFKVLDYTLFQFQSLLLLKLFMPNLILQGQTAGKSMNLIPLITLTSEDLETSLLNILLMTPFGFGLPFITNLRMKRIVALGALFSIGIEVLQLITGLLAGITFRIADINDVIFNTIGVTIGYILFVEFVRICRHISHSPELPTNPVLRYIAERPQIKQTR